MAEDRKTSFADSVDIDYGQPNSLDQQESSKPSFNAAAYDDVSAEFETEQRGSEQVEQDRPEPQPRPTPEFAQEVDRNMHNEAIERDQQAAEEHNKKINEDYQNMLDDMEKEKSYRENYGNDLDYGNER